MNFILNRFFSEKLFIIIIIFFYSNEIFSYDSEIIVITCILIFIILSYYNFRESMYTAFYSKTIKLRTEYINFLVTKRNVENKIKFYYLIFSKKENLVIKLLTHVVSFFKLDLVLQKFSRKFLVYYLFKDKLIFFIKQYSFINRLKFWLILHSFNIKFSIMLRVLELINKFSKTFVKNIFRIFGKYSDVEIYYQKNFKFAPLFLNVFDNSKNN